jgi:hypothetical protein
MRRNDYIFRNQFTPPLVLYRQAEESSLGFANATMPQGVSDGGRASALSKWSPPSIGWLKSNWDAALHKEGKRMG